MLRVHEFAPLLSRMRQIQSKHKTCSETPFLDLRSEIIPFALFSAPFRNLTASNAYFKVEKICVKGSGHFCPHGHVDNLHSDCFKDSHPKVSLFSHVELESRALRSYLFPSPCSLPNWWMKIEARQVADVPKVLSRMKWNAIQFLREQL